MHYKIQNTQNTLGDTQRPREKETGREMRRNRLYIYMARLTGQAKAEKEKHIFSISLFLFSVVNRYMSYIQYLF